MTDLDGLRAAARRIVDDVAAKAGVAVDRVPVQPMAEPGVGEVLIGYRRSPDVGAVVVLSTGGVTAELYDDTAVRLAPIDRATAQEMISEVNGLKAIAGYRGAPAGDLDALADTVVALSRLATWTRWSGEPGRVRRPSCSEGAGYSARSSSAATPLLVRSAGERSTSCLRAAE